ncbi:alkaline phosphatase family protein [Sphingomonas sp. ID0503]|uniref:alkaline phosphatase family protein n=1 Tax=Sphingomonas sp. ID0503 TaxID=3399691 RepID=UPI003AFB5FF8
MIRPMIAAALASVLAAPALAAAPPRPKLIVAISVDQFSANLFAQFRQRYTAGLKRLESEGVVFPSGYQSHAATETCPGHSTILTGMHPSATGIIANNWFDPVAAKEVYCSLDPAGPVPGRPKDPRGPANLKVPTLGEWLKQADGRSRVYAVSGKDRGAIMMAGHNADGTFWWDEANGFTTYVPAGTTAEQRLAPVAAFNKALFAKWAKAPPAWTVLDKSCGWTESRTYGHLTIDHRVPPPVGAPAPAKPFDVNDKTALKWLRASPVFDQITMDLAIKLLDDQKLGRGEATDLLAISLSATDYVGHRYGNQGPEMCDHQAHLDRLIGTLLDRLAALKVPVAVVLTADHGAIDAAERVAERGIPALRFSLGTEGRKIGETLKAEFALDLAPFYVNDEQLYYNPRLDPVVRDEIEARTIALLRALPAVQDVFRKADILKVEVPAGKPADELTLTERFAESIDPVRSGDLLVVTKPYESFGDPDSAGDSIAGHGSPWQYDRRVPILFWWPGAEGFEQPLPIETVDIAPTLAAIAGIPAPKVDGRCLDLDRSKSDICPAR